MGHDDPRSSQARVNSGEVRVSSAGVGWDFRAEIRGLQMMGGLYRRSGRQLVMAALVGQHGDKRYNHLGSS